MNKDILRLALPNIFSNLTIPLLGMVDLALMGRLESSIYIGAVSLGTALFNIIYLSFGFLRMGTTGLTAQAFGRSDWSESAKVLMRGLWVAAGIAVLLWVLVYPIDLIGFFLLDGSEEVMSLARSYYYIRIWAAPATLTLFAFNGWFIGMQNTRIPMIIAIAINLANIGFNLLFIRIFDMKSNGVALGTLMAQYLGLAIAIFFTKRYFKKYRLHFSPLEVLQRKALKKFFRINADFFIRTLLLLFSLSFFTAQSSRMGDDILAANSILLQYLYVFSYFADGFAHAAEALVGRFTGNADLHKLKKSVRYAFAWGIATAILITVLYILGKQELIRLLTDQTPIINRLNEYWIWIVLLPMTSFAAFIWDGIYVGATASVPMRNSMILAVVIIYLPLFYLLHPHLNNHALWIALHAFMLIRGLSLWAYAKRTIYSGYRF